MKCEGVYSIAACASASSYRARKKPRRRNGHFARSVKTYGPVAAHARRAGRAAVMKWQCGREHRPSAYGRRSPPHGRVMAHHRAQRSARKILPAICENNRPGGSRAIGVNAHAAVPASESPNEWPLLLMQHRIGLRRICTREIAPIHSTVAKH